MATSFAPEPTLPRLLPNLRDGGYSSKPARKEKGNRIVSEPFQRGVEFLQQGQFADARASFEQAVAAQPDFALAHINLAVACLELEQLDAALAALERARQLAPESEDVHYNLGVVYEKQKRWDEAQAAYEKAVSLRPTVPETRCNLGNVYREKGWLERAIEQYRAAVDLQPYFGLAHNNLAVTYAMAKDFESAAYHVQIAQALGYPVHADFVSHLRGELAKRKEAQKPR